MKGLSEMICQLKTSTAFIVFCQLHSRTPGRASFQESFTRECLETSLAIFRWITHVLSLDSSLVVQSFRQNQLRSFTTLFLG